MSPNQFFHLLELLNPIILKNNAVRAPIPPDERLAIALRFLASGESWTSLNYYFKIAIASLCEKIEEVYEVIWKHALRHVPSYKLKLFISFSSSIACFKITVYILVFFMRNVNMIFICFYNFNFNKKQ